MTTIFAAAAARRKAKSVALAGTLGLLALGLAGCETGSSLLGSSEQSAPATQLASPAPTQAGSARLAVAPVIGAPESVAKQMQSSLTSALTKKGLSVAQNASDKSDYTLRGYVVSAREKAGVKVSYIWDVTDPAGQRVNRITGEEIAAGAAERDPWSSVSPQIIETISAKTSGQVATWVGSQKPATGAAAATPVAAAATPAAAHAAAAPTKTAAAAAPPASPTTGSIGRDGPATAFVPNVTGAPGDGRISLTSALQRELSRNGLSLTTNTGANTYKVEGVVAVGESKDGKQPIKIDWHVKDPSGKSVGTVSQKNEIAAGALDGPWGATADAAAAAAAQGILKLIPKAN